MKKVFALLFVAGVLAFAACTKKTVEETTTTEVVADSTAMDSTMVAPMDSTMSDTTAK